MKSKTAATLAFGSTLAASLAAMPIANAAGNPFALESLSSGYQVADGDKKADGKCGEGKCGATSHGPTDASDKKADGNAAAAAKNQKQ